MRRNASVRNVDTASPTGALDPSRRRARAVARRGTPWLLALLAVATLRYCLTPTVRMGDNEDAHDVPTTTARHRHGVSQRAHARAGPLWESEQLATTGGPPEEGEEEEEDVNGDDDPGLEVMGEGGRLLDWESTVGVFTTIKKPKHTTPSALKGLSGGGGGGGGGGGDSSAGGTVHDVGVRGFLPRVNKTAIVSRFNPTLRPASRYMHMASIAKVGDRFVAAWQASKTYEGYADQRIWHTFSKDETGQKWGPQRIIPMMDVGRVQWSPVLHMDRDGGKLLLFYSESRLCPRPKSQAEQEATVPPPPPPGLEPGDDPQRWVPGGDIKMVTLDIGVEAAQGRNYSWLRAVRWSQPETLLSTIEADGKPVPKVVANPMAVLSTGEWLLPFWKEPHEAPPCYKENRGSAGVLRSRDKGRTWRVYGELTHPRTWLIENTVVERTDGSVLMIFRTTTGVLYQSLSVDKGRTWGEATATGIPNPDSKVQALRLMSGHLALVFNAHRKLKTVRKARALLDLAISADGGISWVRIARVDGELEPGLRCHYPTMVESEDAQGVRKLYVVYSKFYHEFDPQNRTDLGIQLVELDLAGRLPELGKPIDVGKFELPGGVLYGATPAVSSTGHHAATRRTSPPHLPPPPRELPAGTDSAAIAMLKDLDRILQKTTRVERDHRKLARP